MMTTEGTRMTNPVDGQLARLGVDLDSLDPEVLRVLRDAVPPPSDSMEAAYAATMMEPPDAAERAAEQRAFSNDVARYLGSGRDLQATDDLESGGTA